MDGKIISRVKRLHWRLRNDFEKGCYLQPLRLHKW